MNKLTISFDWIGGQEIKGPELKATYAALSIRYGDTCITESIKSNTISELLYVPLYPLAEWLAFNWWFLQSEVYNSKKYKDETDYPSRHNLFYAQEGYALPDLTISPSGETTELSWKHTDYPYHDLTFINYGTGIVASRELLECFRQFIRKVIDRLEKCSIFDTPLQEEWQAIESTSPDEASFCLLTASLGIDPYAISDYKKEQIMHACKILPEELIHEFFAACMPSQVEKNSEFLKAKFNSIAGKTKVLQSIKDIKEKLARKKAPGSGRPWDIGYRSAKALRKVLNLNGDTLKEMKDLGDVIGASPDDIIERDKNLPVTIQAITGSNKKESPVFIIQERSSDWSEKFLFARSLYGYLFNKPLVPSLVSDSRTDFQKINRAFAAEFLAPAHVLRKMVKKEHLTYDEVEDISHELNISAWVVKHQIINHRIARIEDDF